MPDDVRQDRALTVARPREVRVVEDNSPVAYLFDTARFEHMQRIATAMASASLIPDHLKGKNENQQQTIGNCFLVVNQAVRWNMDPFAVAPETYSIGGKLAYQGKLIAAVVNARAGLKERLRYEHSGKGADRMVTVIGTFKGEDEPRTITLTVREGATNNKMWEKDPDQKLIYSGVTKWARRHCPEVILGVLTDDDLERMAEERFDARPPRPTRQTVVLEGREVPAIEGKATEGAAEPEEITPEPNEAAASEPETASEEITPEPDRLSEDEAFARGQDLMDRITACRSTRELDALEQAPAYKEIQYWPAQQRDAVAGFFEEHRTKLQKAAVPKPKAGQAALAGLEP